MHRKMIAAVALVGATLVGSSTTASAQAGFANIAGLDNIYKIAGNAGSGDGQVPGTTIGLTAGTNRELTFSEITGSWGCASATGYSADGFDVNGNHCVGDANVSASGSISSLYTPGRSMTLAGVFLGGSLPGTAPAGYDYTGAGAFGQTSYAGIQLGQVFFIGDGRTTDMLNGQAPAGTVQMFYVPDGATSLYLGVADACGFVGSPNCDDDNEGSIQATYDVSAVAIHPTPEPATVGLFGAGVLGLGGIVRRRRRA